MKNRIKLFIPVFLSAALAVSVFGVSVSYADSSSSKENNSKSKKIDEMIIVSSRIEQPMREIGTSVSVLTEQDISLIGSNSLADVLRTLPAVNVSNSGGAGKATSLRIRGEEGYRTMVLIDGMNVADPSTPQTLVQVDQIMTAGIGRVEVLRGSQGMMYGADAGGVVNISTRQLDDGFAGSVGGQAGRYGTQQLFGQIGGGNELADLYLSATDYKTDGFNASTRDLYPTDDDGYENTTYHARFGINFAEGWRLEWVTRQVDGVNEYDNVYASTDFVSNEYDQNNNLISVSYDGSVFDHEIVLQKNKIIRENFTGKVFDYFYRGEIKQASYIGSWALNDKFSFVAGADFKEEASKGTYSEASERDQKGFFVELQSEIVDQLLINAGVRADDNDNYGKHNSYRVTGAKIVSLSDSWDLKLKASASTGFRAPSLYEIDYNQGPYAAPPATTTILQEENSRSYDGGIELFSAEGLHVEIIYFDQKIEDKIYFDLATYAGYLQDDGSSRSTGVEASVKWPIGDHLTVAGNYTRNNTEEADGTLQFRRPRNSANIQISSNFFEEKLLLVGNWRYSGHFFENTGGFLPPDNIDGYKVIDLGVHYYFVDDAELFFRIENATNQDYIEVPTYNTAGRSGYVGINYQF